MVPSTSPSKFLLVAGPPVRRPQASPAPIRRYRLARLRFDGRPASGASAFEHLKRVYD